MKLIRSLPASTLQSIAQALRAGRLKAAWTGSIKLTVKQPKTSTSIRWCAMSGSSYAAISRGKQIR